MVVGVGIDIVEIERIQGIHSLERFAEFFLTARELGALTKAKDPVQFLASRFAVKEAVIKAFPKILSPHEFEIAKRGGKPVLRFLSPRKFRRYRGKVSISHSTQYAAGYAILSKK